MGFNSGFKGLTYELMQQLNPSGCMTSRTSALLYWLMLQDSISVKVFCMLKDQHRKIYKILSDVTEVTNLSTYTKIVFHKNLEDKT